MIHLLCYVADGSGGGGFTVVKDGVFASLLESYGGGEPCLDVVFGVTLSR